MPIDPRLNDIDDCLYRVAVRVLVMQDSKLLLIKEKQHWWAFPGGGVDHGETVESALIREVEEELGVPASRIRPDRTIAYYNIGTVLNGVPRMNLYFKVSVPERLLQNTDHIVKWAWFTKAEFLQADLHPTYDKTELANVIFGN